MSHSELLVGSTNFLVFSSIRSKQSEPEKRILMSLIQRRFHRLWKTSRLVRTRIKTTLIHFSAKSFCFEKPIGEISFLFRSILIDFNANNLSFPVEITSFDRTILNKSRNTSILRRFVRRRSFVYKPSISMILFLTNVKVRSSTFLLVENLLSSFAPCRSLLRIVLLSTISLGNLFQIFSMTFVLHLTASIDEHRQQHSKWFTTSSTSSENIESTTDALFS